MQQNIKVDMIYYLTPSDFEMEFNLCGCCHMRLLTEKAQDRQSFVKSLARAVSRSKIIIACGPLFDDNGLIKTVSKAIGVKTEFINNDEYGINCSEAIEVMQGATPLVTPEGFFGGCIIESGPQSIIVLSENKSVRKTIMSGLIHQYIFELSMMPESAPVHADEGSDGAASAEEEKEEISDLTEDNSCVKENDDSPSDDDFDAAAAADIAAAVTGMSGDIAEKRAALNSGMDLKSDDLENDSSDESENTDENLNRSEENMPKTDKYDEDKSEISFITGQDDENTEDEYDDGFDNGMELYIEPEKVEKKSIAEYSLNYTPSQKDEMFISDSEDDFDYDGDDRRDFGKISGTKLSVIIIAVVIALIAVVLAYLLVYVPYSKGIGMSSYVQQIFGDASSV